MLKFLRKNTKIIVWMVVIAFVAWGGYAVSVQFQEAYRSPGRVFGKEVSFREYLLAQRAVQIFAPARAQEEEPMAAEEIEARTWQFLVFSREAKRRKINVTDEEVRLEITRLLAPGEGEGLSQEEYLLWVRTRLREEPREFEKQVKENLRIRKLFETARKERGLDTEEKLQAWLVELLKSTKIEVYALPSPSR